MLLLQCKYQRVHAVHCLISRRTVVRPCDTSLPRGGTHLPCTILLARQPPATCRTDWRRSSSVTRARRSWRHLAGCHHTTWDQDRFSSIKRAVLVTRAVQSSKWAAARLCL